MTSTYNVPTIIPEKRHEVWHQSDAGDWRVSYFEIPLNARQLRTPMAEWSNVMREDFAARLKTAFQEHVKKWARMLEGEHEVPTTRPLMRPEVYFSPEPGREEYRRFYVAARVKRETPELLPLDSFAQIADLGPVDDGEALRNFFGQMGSFSEGRAQAEEVGRQARENAGLEARAAKERAFEKELEYRLNHRPF